MATSRVNENCCTKNCVITNLSSNLQKRYFTFQKINLLFVSLFQEWLNLSFSLFTILLTNLANWFLLLRNKYFFLFSGWKLVNFHTSYGLTFLRSKFENCIKLLLRVQFSYPGHIYVCHNLVWVQIIFYIFRKTILLKNCCIELLLSKTNYYYCFQIVFYFDGVLTTS